MFSTCTYISCYCIEQDSKGNCMLGSQKELDCISIARNKENGTNIAWGIIIDAYIFIAYKLVSKKDTVINNKKETE